MVDPMGDEVDAIVEAWAGELPDATSEASALAKRITLLAAAFGEAGRRELAERELTYAEFDVLVTLRRSGSPYQLTPSVLTRSLLLTSGGVSNVLQRLEASGLIVRQARAEDARSRWVQLTAEGRRVAEDAVTAVRRAHEEVLAEVPDAAVRRASGALREVMVARRRR